MKPYGNGRNDSGVVAYDEGRDWIDVQFTNRMIYRYTRKSAGEEAVEQMRDLAHQGEGLSTYISQNDPPYASQREPPVTLH